MNPFDLGGMEFLIFYAVFGAAVVGLRAMTGARGRADMVGASDVDPSDPYLIAYLRAGANEALRVATLALIDRGLLVVDAPAVGDREPELKAARDARDKVRRPVEKAILDRFKRPAAADSVYDATGPLAAVEQYRDRLVASGLLPDQSALDARVTAMRVAWVALWLVAGARIIQALGAGRQNVAFLVILAVFFSWAVWRVGRRTRTASGDRALNAVTALFSGLHARLDQLAPGGATNEMALAAAVYGVGALPDERFPFVRKVYRRATTRGGSAACGSGCGGGSGWGGFSFGGDGGGGDGGGGGCGGGCGGCGGG